MHYFRGKMLVFPLILVGCWLLWKRRTDGLTSFDLPLAWLAKIGASCVFIYIYSWYYGSGTLTADPDAFMRESALLQKVAAVSPFDYLRFLTGTETPAMIRQYLSETAHWSAGDLTLINDSKNVIRVNSLLLFISGGSICFHAFFLGLLSTLGFREVYLAFRGKTALPDRVLWWIIILMPGVLFWTAGILKEPLLMVGLSLVLRAWMGELPLWSRGWRAGLGLLLMLGFKPYVLGCFLLAGVVYLTGKWFFRKRPLLAPLPGIVLSAVVFGLLPSFREHTTHYLTRKQFDFVNIGQGGLHAYADTCFFYFRPDQFQYLRYDKGDTLVWLTRPLKAKQVVLGKAHPFYDVYLHPNTKPWLIYFRSSGCSSNIEVTPIGGSFGQLIRNIPEALCNAGLRPLPGDPGGWLKYLAMLETLGLCIWIIVTLRGWRDAHPETKLQVITLWFFALALLLLIGWTTPVLGALVRYRIPAYFALVLAGILLYRKRRAASERDTI